MHEADLFTPLAGPTKKVRCDLCAHHCTIADGNYGICRVRRNIDGKLFSLVYGTLVTEHADPIEKKPLFHFLPGSSSYSIATVGCNFHCRHCQNAEISQYPALHNGRIAGHQRTAEWVVHSAKENHCASISYTYIEPTVFFEFAYDTARLAHAAGLKNVFVSNGYTSPAATRKIAPYLDANNIDLKSFNDNFYRQICGARLQPVLDTITLMKELGVWVEITTLIIPGWNDASRELENLARFIVQLDPAIPWHVSRFHPAYRLTDCPPTPMATIEKARAIGLAAGLHHVYSGNLPGDPGEATYCHHCKHRLIDRYGFMITHTTLRNGRCPHCDTPIAGIWA